MATAAVARVDNQVPHHGDKIVRRLDEFPELLQALRDGDLSTVRLIWAQLFSIEGVAKSTQLPSRDKGSLKIPVCSQNLA